MAQDKTPPSSLPPSNKTFIEPMLKVLGRKTGFKEGVYVHNKELHVEIVKEAGFDPDNLEQYGKPEDGWTMWGQHPLKDGLARRIWYAHRECFYDKARKKGMPKLTTRGPKRGTWGLTKLGAEKAKALCDTSNDNSSGGGNVTSEFLQKRLAETGGLRGTLYGLMESAVKAKLPMSATIGIVDDHIQTCMLKLVQRDALRERILSGTKVTDSHLATYAVRSGFTDIRRDGTEPVCREMYGARTERERSKMKAERERREREEQEGFEVRPTVTKDKRITWHRDDGEWMTIADVEDTEAVDGDVAMAQMAFEDTWQRIEAIVRANSPRAWQRYVTILHRVTDGWSIKEIARAEGVSRNRAATLVAEARKCVRDSRDADLLSAVL